MFQYDLQEFKNSDEFRNYLQYHDIGLDKAEAVSIGWLLALVAEMSVALNALLRWILRKIKNGTPVQS